jgi:hypothetical protein
MATFSICRIAPKHQRMLFVLLALSLSRGPALAAEPPAWWDDPIKEDPGNYFFTASGASADSSDAALEEAQHNALDQIVERVGSPAGAKDYLLGRIRGWNLHARHDQKDGRTHRVWIILKYSKDELGGLRTHVEGGQARFEEAAQAFEKKKVAEALSISEALAAEYPIGKQPIFPTERALLLASDCHVALGQPRQALEACRSVLAGSQDAAFTKEAEAKTTAIRADYTNLLLRGIFAGKRIAVRCLTEIDGSPAAWSKMQTEIGNVVKQAGGRMLDSDEGSLGADKATQILTNEELRAEITRSLSADGVLVVRAQGRLNERENSKNPMGGKDFQFAGTTASLLLVSGSKPYAWKRTGVTGWNPISVDMCMEVLALNVLNVWREDLARHLDGKE